MKVAHRGRGSLAVVIALALVGAGIVVVTTGRIVVAGPVEVDTGDTLAETASASYTYDTRAYEDLPLNTPISVTFFDSDLLTHTFTILNRSDYEVPWSSTYPTSSLLSLDMTYGTLDNVNASYGTYAPASTIPPVSSPGWYEFYCIEGGHFAEGMYGFIAFGENLPANLSFASGTPGPGLAVFIIIGTIVTLTVLALVLGFVVGRRQGSEHEMSPERLGYPEPPTSEPLPSSPPRPPTPP